MTPSGELREAAALLRARAEKATAAPWTLYDRGVCWEIEQLDEHDGTSFLKGDAEWIAMMSPAVAEPIAAMLEHAADTADVMDRNTGGQCPEDQYVASVAGALRVARSITKAREA